MRYELSRALFSDVDRFSDEEDQALLSVGIAFGALSLIMSLLVLISYYTFKSLRTRSFLLVSQLAYADIGADISYFMGDPRDGSSLCTTQGLFQQFFQLAVFIWATIIAVTLYTKLVLRHLDVDFWKLLCIGYGVPFFLTILPLTTMSYGQTGGWCWIEATASKDFDVGTMWRFLTFYAVLWVCILLNAFLMYKVTVYVRSVVASAGGDPSESAQKMLATVSRLKYYPLILIICWVPGTINRIQNSAEPTNPIFVLQFFQVLFRSMQGILNALAYGLNRTVRATWLQSCKLHYPAVYAFVVRIGFIGDEQQLLLESQVQEEDTNNNTGLASKIELQGTSGNPQFEIEQAV